MLLNISPKVFELSNITSWIDDLLRVTLALPEWAVLLIELCLSSSYERISGNNTG